MALNLTVDYSIPAASTFHGFNQFLSLKHGILGLLAEVDRHWTGDPFIATWASSVSHPTPKTFVPLVFHNLHTVEESDFAAGGDHERRLTLHPGHRLEIHGKALGTISHASIEPESIGPGTIDPEILHRYHVGRKLMRLDINGKVALVPERAQQGDLVFVFPGFRVPYVLRRGGMAHSAYTYVGEA